MNPFNNLRLLVLTLGLCCGFLAVQGQAPSKAKPTGDQTKLNALQNGVENPATPGLVYPNTGNPDADAATYEQNKLNYMQANQPNAVVRPHTAENVNMNEADKAAWIAAHPSEYSGANTISRADFNALPAAKQAAMKNAGFTIIEPTNK